MYYILVKFPVDYQGSSYSQHQTACKDCFADIERNTHEFEKKIVVFGTKEEWEKDRLVKQVIES
jgi:hypothetical protein